MLNMTNVHATMDNTRDTSSLVSVVSQAVILLILLVVSIVSNLLVFVVFYQRPALRSLSNRFVLSLVSSNLLTAIFLMPVSLVSLLMQQWVFTIWCCKASKVVAALLTIACTLSLVLIAIDRYLAIMSPLHYNMIVTRSRCSAMIASVWAVATALSMLPVMGLTDTDADVYKTPHPDVEILMPCISTPLEAHTLCSEGHVNASISDVTLPVTQFRLCGTVTSTVVSLVRQKHRPWFALLLGLVGFGLPLFLIGWIYVCMYRAAHRTSARARKHSVITFNACDLPSLDSSVMSRSTGLVNQIVTTSPMNTTTTAAFHDHHSLQQIRKRLYRRRSSNTSLSFILFREEGKAATTSIMVVGSLLGCCLPYFASALWEAFAPFRHGCHDITLSDVLTSPTFQAFSQLLLFAGCAINPFIYVYRNNIARKDAVRLLRCQLNPKQHMSNTNAFYKQDMRKRGAIPVRTPSADENDSETPPPSIVVRLDNNNFNNNDEDDADTTSLASCNGTVIVVTNGLSEPSLVRKLSKRVCKSVSLAEDVLIKGRRPSMRKPHHEGYPGSDDDQVKMVDFCADDFEMVDSDDAATSRSLKSHSVNEDNHDERVGSRSTKKRLSIKRLTRSLSKGMNSNSNNNNNNNRFYNNENCNANINSNVNINISGRPQNETETAADTVLMIRNTEAEVTPFTFRVSNASLAVQPSPKTNKKARISKDDFLLMAEPNNGASDKGRKSEPDLSAAAAALNFHSNSQRSAVSANSVCGYGLAPDLTHGLSVRNTSSNPFLPVTSEQTFRANPALFVVTNPFAEVTSPSIAGIHVTGFSASNSPSVHRHGEFSETRPSSHASSTSSIGSKIPSNSTANSSTTTVYAPPDITIDVTDASGNSVGWPTSFI